MVAAAGAAAQGGRVRGGPPAREALGSFAARGSIKRSPGARCTRSALSRVRRCEPRSRERGRRAPPRFSPEAANGATLSRVKRASSLLVVAIVLAGATVAYVIGRSTRSSDSEATVERPLTVHQGSVAQKLLTRRCPEGLANEVKLCPRRPYPRQQLPSVDTGRPFRLTFSSTARVDLSLWHRTAEGYRRDDAWDGSLQCIDSACVTAVSFPRDRRRQPRAVPKTADTLRVVVFGDPVEGAEIALAPRR
jgi:hypothetical protein